MAVVCETLVPARKGPHPSPQAETGSDEQDGSEEPGGQLLSLLRALVPAHTLPV